MFVSIFLFSIEASGSQSGQKGYIPKARVYTAECQRIGRSANENYPWRIEKISAISSDAAIRKLSKAYGQKRKCYIIK